MAGIPDTRIEPFNFKRDLWTDRTNAQRVAMIAISSIVVLGLTFLALSYAGIGPFPNWDHSFQNLISTDPGSTIFITTLSVMAVASTFGMYAWCDKKSEKEADKVK